MLTISYKELEIVTQRILVAWGTPEPAARTVAQSLVLGNLKGHDSHGVIRVIEYVDWIERGWIQPTAALQIIKDAGSILMVDGNYGFGQVIGREATSLAISKTRKEGICVLTIRRSSHLGRIGEWMEMAADAGLVAFSFTNTHGGGVLVAPHGGRDRRLSANPLAGGAPLPDGSSLIMDMATSAIAEGKIKVAREKGEALPAGCVVNGRGEPSVSPEEYYAEPPGALLPFAGHKGYSLSLFAEVLAGALSGGACSRPGVDRIANTFCGFFLDPAAFVDEGFFANEVGSLVQWVKSSRPMEDGGEVLLPGEPENAEYQKRSSGGIPLPETTWKKILMVASSRDVSLDGLALPV